MSDHTAPPTRRSAWTLKQNLARVIWGTGVQFVWILVPPLRPALIRLFGGTVGPGCRFARRVEICIPWNLTIGARCRFADRTILYSLGSIAIGDDVVLDYRAHLCAGTHDISDPSFPLLRPPIRIGDHSFIGADAYVGPDVTLGANCTVWPRASVYKDFPDHSVIAGNPARETEGDPSLVEAVHGEVRA